MALSCGDAGSPPAAELLGQWQTEAPGYRGRLFEIREDGSLFWTSPATNARHRLEGVERSADQGADRVYRLEYREIDGALSTLELIYHPAASPELRFAHRGEVWRRRRAEGGGGV